MKGLYNPQMGTFFSGVLVIVSLAGALVAQETVDLSVVSRIKTEAFDNSQVMDTLGYLTDVYGPRLTASPEFKQAADWVVQRLHSYGIENAALEKWGPFGRSWTLKQSSLEMLEPRYASLDAQALAWSERTQGPVSGEVILAPFGDGTPARDPKKLEADLNKYMADWKGKLKGKIVLFTPTSTPTRAAAQPEAQIAFRRFTDKELSDLAMAPEPARRAANANSDAATERRQALTARRAKFLRDEGALAVITTSDTSRDGLVFAQAAGSYDAKDELAAPTFVVTREQYERMVRLIGKKVPVKVRVNLDMESSPANVDSYNVSGEIPGGAKKDEIIAIGAHLDSWHSGTGATDNGAGSAVMIEVMRILQTLNLKLDRTVRIVLWSGEEEGLLGSKAYVKEHFGDPATMKLTDAHAKFSGYFNLDNGSGKIRGVYLQQNDAMRPIFEQWLAPFKDQGVTTISIRNTGGTDHLSFDAVGLPGFQFIQDPLDYSSNTHHSNMDTLDHIQAPDLMQAAAVIATVVYDAANRPEMLPRKALPVVRAK